MIFHNLSEFALEWRRFWSAETPASAMQVERLRLMEGHLMLPVKAAAIVVLFYYLFFGIQLEDLTSTRLLASESYQWWTMLMKGFQTGFVLYFALATATGFVLAFMGQFSFAVVQWIVFTVCLVDALFVSALTLVTGGFDSILFWVLLTLIIRNTVSISMGAPQITANLVTTGAYVVAGLVDVSTHGFELENLTTYPSYSEEVGAASEAAEPFILRVALLLLMTVCCHGVQVLFDRQRRAEEESREFALRQQQMQATGRLAAEIAHQLKNPLGIINNAAFTLQRTVKEGKTITQQISIIREEVARSDRIITELMGYARLSEGRVERVEINNELDRAVDEVFPAAVQFQVKIHRNYAPALPSLLIQRAHLSEVFVNLLQNAREAMQARGNIWLSTAYREDYSVVIHIRDDGPGIAPPNVEKIFEPYFTTKEKGTGLGLAIVKHNTEINGGTVTVESELGKGTEFVLNFPAKSLFKLRK